MRSTLPYELFDSTCDPVELGGMIFNSLSWADDMVIISKSKAGLQKCLDQLQKYCERWQLTVNISKTKVMVLSAGTSQIKDVLFDGELLECVPSYKYLGLVFSSNGNLGKMEDMINKARKALFVIRQAIKLSLSSYMGTSIQ